MPRAWSCLLIAGLGLSGACWAQMPCLEAERQKNLGVAYLEQEQPAEAAAAFRRVVALAPEEPLGYANLGLSFVRAGQADSALVWLQRARDQAPGNVEVLVLTAEVYLWAGDASSAGRVARQALEVDPDSRLSLYAAYRSAAVRRGSPESLAAAALYMSRLARLAPENLVVAMKYSRQCGESGDIALAESAVAHLKPMVSDLPLPLEMLSRVEAAIADSNAAAVRRSIAVLENVLRPSPRYRQSLWELQSPVSGGVPLLEFPPSFHAQLAREAPPSVPVRFVRLRDGTLPGQPGPVMPPGSFTGQLDVADVDGDGRQDLVVSSSGGAEDGLQLWLNRPEGWSRALAAGRNGETGRVRLVDFDNNGILDIVSAGANACLLMKGDSAGVWRDVTGEAGLVPEPRRALCWMDADNEGDLDLVLATPDGIRLWQNRLDGTFTEVAARSGLSEGPTDVVQALPLDQDDDLDTDLFLVDAEGRIHLFDNLRQGRFAPASRGVDRTRCQSILAPDVDNDGLPDLVLLTEDGNLGIQLNRSSGFGPCVLLSAAGSDLTAFESFDFDNDGWMDLAAARSTEPGAQLVLLRNGGDGSWTVQVVGSLPADGVSIKALDLENDGDLDLFCLDASGGLSGWRNDGGNVHRWLKVRLRGIRSAGTKNNLHGVGSKLEVKAGRHYQMRIVRQPVTHFGLGRHTAADLMRVMWSNGVPQNQIHPTADQTVFEPQILKGSCPYLYGWDGEKFAFVTDVLAGAPLGLQVADGVIAPDNPRELLTISRDRIVSRDGDYVLQYTEELWETVYLDAVSLWAVDRPADLTVLTDQRYTLPPYEVPRPVFLRDGVEARQAVNTMGEDVTDRVASFDYKYPERLGPTRYQGIVSPHTLEVTFGDIGPMARPMLVIGGWTFWTDTSINVSRSQGSAVAPGNTTLEVWHAKQGWRPLDLFFGLLNGKDKWALIDLSGAIDRSDARVRIRSTAQMYWDRVYVADAHDDAAHRITQLQPRSADLHFGGYSRLYRPAEDGPHLYDYADKTHGPVWFGMTGMATRYGDVTELVSEADDRFVVFTAGDEVTLKFSASELPELPKGWVRDFLFYNEGWEKDADRNTVAGPTVGPLPFHGMSAYPYPEGEAFPSDSLHTAYVRDYLTRRIGPEAFRRFVRDFTAGDPAELPWEGEPGVRGHHEERRDDAAGTD